MVHMLDHSRDSHGEKTECRRKGVRGKTRRRLEIKRLADKFNKPKSPLPPWWF